MGLARAIARAIPKLRNSVPIGNEYLIKYGAAFINNDGALVWNEGTGENAVGYSGKSYDFNGTNSFVDTNQTTTFDRDDTLEIEAWVKTDNINSYCIISNVNQALPSVDDYRGFYFGIDATGKLEFFLSNRLNSNSNVLRVKTSSSVIANKWLKVKVTYDNSSLASGVEFYINDIQQSKDTPLSDTLSGTTITTQKIQIGAFYSSLSGLGGYFDGQISDCSITINSVLTHQFEFNQASGTGVFNAVTGVLAIPSNCTLVEAVSGYNYDVAVSEALKDDAGVYEILSGGIGFYTLSPVISLLVGEYLTIRYIYFEGVNSTILYNSSGGIDRIVQETDVNNKILFRINGLNYRINGGIINGINVARIERTVTGYDLTFNGNDLSIVSSDDFVVDLLGRFNDTLVLDIDYNGLIYNTSNQWQSAVKSLNPHKQQFPEVGIPQSFSKNWNRYDYFNNNAYVICNTSDFDTQADGQVVELDFIVGNVGGAGYVAFSVRDNVANPNEYILVASQSNAVYLYVLNGSLKSDSVAVSVGQRVVATLIFNGVGLTCTLVGTIDGTPFSLSTSAFGAFSPISKMTLGATFVSSYSQLFQGLFIGATINSTVYNVFNNYNSIGLSGTTPVKNLAPENPSSLGNDIFANAIVDPQPKFKLDGASYIDTNYINDAILKNTPFEFECTINSYRTGVRQAIFTNTINGITGHYLFWETDDSLRYRLISGASDRVGLGETGLSPNTSINFRCVYNGNEDSTGFTIYIDGVEIVGLSQDAGTIGDISSLNSFVLGMLGQGNTHFTGSLDNFKFKYL